MSSQDRNKPVQVQESRRQSSLIKRWQSLRPQSQPQWRQQPQQLQSQQLNDLNLNGRNNLNNLNFNGHNNFNNLNLNGRKIIALSSIIASTGSRRNR